MPEKTLLFTTETCPVCVDTKALLAPEIAAGKIEVVEASTPKAREILKQVAIKEVPECIVETNGRFTRCNFEALVKRATEGKL